MVLIIPNTYLVSIKGSSGGQDVVNVIGVEGTGNTAISVATAVLGAWKTAGGPLSKLTTAYTMLEVKAMDLSSASGDVYTVTDSTAGTLSPPLATNAACALITYGSGTRAKSERGRMYFGPLRESDVNTDGRTLANAAGFTTAFGAFKTALEINNRKWVVISRKNSSTTDIVSVTTQSVIATQRRRIR